jgi:RNA polymerase sigma-70 factor (ECF subfamily)
VETSTKVRSLSEHPEDLDLARRLVAGEQQLFTHFFEMYFPRVYRFALSRLDGDVDAAEEVTQRTLCRAVRKLALYRGEASLITWLCQICRNEISDFVAARARHLARFVEVDDDSQVRAAVESVPAPEAYDPLESVARSDRSRLVQVVLDDLPARYGDVLEWKYVEGLRVDEIARRLEVTALAAESMLARARRSFRDAWRKLAGDWLSDAEENPT